MPLSDPYSSYLDRLARQRAEDELMRSRLGEASKQFQGGLGQWNEALRVQKADTRQAEQDTAKTAQTAFENEQTVEGLRLRKAQDARDAAQAQAREAREATEFTAKQAARPIEEARAAEDRAFTLRQRETSTADAARKAAIEKIKALPPETAMGDDVDVHGFIVQTGAAGGLTPDEALGIYRDAQQARTDAKRTADLEARAKEAQIKKLGRVPVAKPRPSVPTPTGPTTAARSDAIKKANAAGELLVSVDVVEDVVNDPRFKDYTGPIDGLGTYLTSRLKMSDEDAAEIVTTLGMYFDDYRVAVTGAAASDEEMKMLATRAPDVRDSLSTVRGKLKAARSRATARQRYWEGASTGAAPNSTPAAPPSAPTANVPDDDNW